MARWRLWSVPWTAAAMLCVGWISADRLRAAEGAAERLTEAYEKTKSASTLEDYSEIIELCEQARQAPLAESSAEYARKLLSWAYNRRGERYIEQAAVATAEGETERAAELDEVAAKDFQQSIELDPLRWKAIHNRGVSLALRGEYALAIADFTRVIELDPGHSDARFNRGEMLYEVGRYDEALADYTDVIAARPDDQGAWLGRGHTHYRLGQFRQALADYDEMIRLDDQQPAGYINRGEVYEQLGQWEQAAGDFQAAIRLDRRSHLAYQHAAWLMATCPVPRFRNAALAVQAAERAVELDAQRGWAVLDVLAAALANAGRFQEAVAVGSEALPRTPAAERAAVEDRVQRYRQGQPYRQPLPNTASLPGDEVSR